jgi:hypothetical protein
VIPGVPTSISVTAPAGIGAGSFYGFWGKPATGYLTLIDCCEQYDTVNTFNSADLITFTFGQWLEFAQGFDPNKTYYFRFAAKNQSGIASDATTHAAVDSISRDGSVGWGPFSAAFGPVTSLPMPMSSLSATARGQHGVYLETFETYPNANDWTHASYGTSTLLTNGGITGKNALQCDGYEIWYYKGHIPFDRSKLYRMRMTVKVTGHADVSKLHGYFLLVAYDTNLALITPSDAYGAYYFGCSDLDLYSVAHDTWYDITGYFRGVHGSTYPGLNAHPLATAPGVLPETCRYIGIGFVVNGPGTPNTGNITLIDNISIDVMDEGAVVRSYLGINLNGTIAANMVIANSILADSVTAGKIDVTDLAAINADMGLITAGTITSAHIRTAASGARIELNHDDGLISYDSDPKITGQITTGGVWKVLTLGGYNAGSGYIEFLSDGIEVRDGASGYAGIELDATNIAIKANGHTIGAPLTLQAYQNGDDIIFKGGSTEYARFLAAGRLQLVGGAAPGTPASGGTLYEDAGALKWVSKGGKTTTIATDT